jgi:hypothetical protein
VGSMQESPTLLILRCRARHCWERHSHLPRTGLLQCTSNGTRKLLGARLLLQRLVRAVRCAAAFCFLPPVRWSPDVNMGEEYILEGPGRSRESRLLYPRMRRNMTLSM